MSDRPDDWHGWRIKADGVTFTIAVGPLPMRKSICLYSMNGSVMDVHAYFRSEEHARTFLALLDEAIP